MNKGKYNVYSFYVKFKNDYMEAVVRLYIEAYNETDAYRKAKKLEIKLRNTNPTLKSCDSTYIRPCK